MNTPDISRARVEAARGAALARPNLSDRFPQHFVELHGLPAAARIIGMPRS
jgi:hypothetical protein